MSDREPLSGTRLRERTAEELRVLLARKRMSATELARRTGMKQPYISRRMTGEIAFDLDDLEVIARELGVSVVELLGGNGSQTTEAKVRLPERTMPTAQKAQPQPNGRSPHVVNVASLRPARIRRGPRAPLHPMTASA